MHILTIDVEEWFHLLDFDATRGAEQWESYPVRIHENVDRLLSLLDETGSRATFFVIGWIAKKYPDVVRKIGERYEVGTHTMNHQLVWQQSPSEFLSDLDSSVKLLEDVTGKKVRCFRAPGFSIRTSESWAFDIMSQCGIDYDSSIFPAHHAHGGMPSFGDQEPAVICRGGIEIKEFPISFKTIAGRHIIYSGGGYFRLMPYGLIRRWSSEQDDYQIAYIHPRDLDGGQPMLEGLPLSRRFKSYVGLHHAEQKMRQWLTDFPFSDIAQADMMIDWEKANHINL